MEAHPARKLAVIVHADVVGSTALFNRDETLTYQRIRSAFERLSLSIETYGGATHEIRGDALVGEFQRASDAVAAALAFQVANTESNAALTDDIQPRLRIGISLGEVVIADETVTGAGVVLAQRVEQLAEADGVCITGAIREAIPERLPISYSDRGKHEVKGFADAVQIFYPMLADGAAPIPPDTSASSDGRQRISRHAWALGGTVVLLVILAGGVTMWPSRAPDEDPGANKGMMSTVPDKPSIAVLPFTNMSDDPEQEYFSDGLTEDLITEISRISGLRVIARHSSFAYKHTDSDIQTISRELGARYIVDGSLRRSGDRLRINAQLIDAEDGTHMWAERYDRKLIDVFQLQDEVTQTIVSALAVTLTQDEEQFLDRVRTANPDAYDALLRGLEPLHRFTREDSALAREYFMQAIALDPGFARAHANLALTYGQDVSFGWTDDQAESIRLALKSIEQAEALDETITQTHFARATIQLIQKEYDDAVTTIRRAIDLDPNYADGYGQLAITLMYAGELENALSAIRTAKRLNPRYPFVYLWIEGHTYFLLSEYQKTIEIVEEVLDRNPAFEIARVTMIATYGQLALDDEAAWEVDELLTLRPEYSLATARREALHQQPEDLHRFIDGLRRAGIPE